MGSILSSPYDPPRTYKSPQRYATASRSPATSQSSTLAAPPKPVAAISTRYCSAQPLTLHLKEKSFSLSGDDFTIRNASTGQVQFRIDGSALSMSDRKTLLNASNQPVAYMRHELLSFMPSFYVSRDRDSRSVLLTIKAKWGVSTVLDCSFRNESTGKQCKLSVQGDWRARSAGIYLEQPDASRMQIARVYRPVMTSRNLVFGAQDYYVDIAPNVDSALIALVCVAIDESKKD